MGKQLTDAIVVRVVDYGEADRVVTLLTREVGKVAALARGARRSKKRFGSGLQLFSAGQAMLSPRRGELWALESFDERRGYPHLSLEMARVAHAAYACELARELLPDHHPEPRVYALLDEMLRILDGAQPRAELLRAFELSVLDAVGLAPSLDLCVGCGGPASELFDGRRGGVLCRACGMSSVGGARAIAPSVMKALRLARETPLAEAVGLAFAPGDGEAVRDLLQALLRDHLGKSLRSVEFIAKLNAGAPGG